MYKSRFPMLGTDWFLFAQRLLDNFLESWLRSYRLKRLNDLRQYRLFKVSVNKGDAIDYIIRLLSRSAGSRESRIKVPRRSPKLFHRDPLRCLRLINYCYSGPLLNARWVCFFFTFDDSRVRRDIKIILAIYGGIMMMGDKRRVVRENRNPINKQCRAPTVRSLAGLLHRLFSMWQLLHV